MADLEKKLILDIFEMLEIALSELKLTLVLYEIGTKSLQKK